MKMRVDLDQIKEMKRRGSLDTESIEYYFHDTMDAVDFFLDCIDELEDTIDEFREEIDEVLEND